MSILVFRLSKYDGFFILVGIGVLGIGGLISYLAGLLVAAFGELVENSSFCAQYLYYMSGGTNANQASGTAPAVASGTPLGVPATTAETHNAVTNQQNYIKVCQICGTVNDPSEYTCKNCGMGLPNAVPADNAQIKDPTANGGNAKFKVCPKCSAENRFSQKYCEVCGGSI